MADKQAPDMRSWSEAKCEHVIHSCRVEAVDGTILFTPDGVGHYGALWTRDFAYLVEHGYEFLQQAEIRAAIEVLLAGQREDGAIPDRVNDKLVPIYHPGPVEQPLGATPALDNAMFMVALVFHYHRHFNDAEFVRAVLPSLHRALEFVPRNRGLVFNDAQRPACTYGFQDNVAKGGHDLFCSLLYIVACRQMAELEPGTADFWRDCVQMAEDNLWLLWDEDAGYYMAANEACRQFDVWGNAYAVAMNIGDAERQSRIAHTLAACYDSIVYKGQVRHLPSGEYWERLLLPVAEDTYQNGGYWGTASGWLIETLRTVDPTLAEQTFQNLMASYKQEGVFEWISPDGSKGPDLYVATIVNLWSLIKVAEVK